MRYDKYDGMVGGFRAPLHADFAGTLETAYGVGLNSSGRVVVGAGVTGVLGILVLTNAKSAGDIVDIMTSGECVEAGLAAGTVYFAHATTGVLSTTNTGTRVGHTVEADRLVVRVIPLDAA